jgi:signal transduction histidine kinase
VVGKYVDEVIPAPSLDLVLAKYREAIAERRTVRWDEVTDYPTGRKHGEVSITPLVDAAGRCTELLGLVHDVTERRQARALRAGEKQVLELAASGAPLDEALAAVVRLIEDLATPAIASVLLLSDDGTRLLHGAAPHLPEAFNRAIDGAAIGPRAGSCGTAAALRRQVIVTDVETDPLWTDYRDLAHLAGVRACWSTPIVGRDGRVLGTFALYYRTPRSPTPGELELIARVTHVTGIVLQRRELDQRLRQLSARIEAAREEERTGIAREIHDQLGQALTVMKMDLAWIARRAATPDGVPRDALLDRLHGLLGMCDQIIGEVRRISAELRPGILDDLGLDAAIAWAAQEFERRTQIRCVVRSGIADDERLPREIETGVFRVLQEALTNVVRHAGATQVEVLIEEEPEGLLLQVADDGRGITPEQIHDPRSIGLVGMSERARRMGGVVTFERRAPGTVVTLRVPCAPSAP